MESSPLAGRDEIPNSDGTQEQAGVDGPKRHESAALPDVLKRLAAIDESASADRVYELASEALVVLCGAEDVRALKSEFIPEDIRALLKSMRAVHPENRPAPRDIRRRASVELDRLQRKAASRDTALLLFREAPRKLAKLPRPAPPGRFAEMISPIAFTLACVPAIVSPTLGGFAISGVAALLPVFLLIASSRRTARRRMKLFEDGTIVVGRIEDLTLTATRNKVTYSFEFAAERHRGTFSLAFVLPEEHYEGAEIAVFVDDENPKHHAPIPMYYGDHRTMPR